MHIEVTDSLDEPRRAQWLDFLARSEHSHPEQDPRFAEGWRAQGHDIVYTMGWDGDALCAVAMFHIAREPGVSGFFPTAAAVSGPICDTPQTMLEFLELIERHEAFSRVSKLKVTPYWLAPGTSELAETFERAGWAPFEEDYLRTTGIHDITGTPDDIAARFNRTARRKLRKSREAGLQIDYVTDEPTAMEVFSVYDGHFEARFGDRADERAFMSDFRNVYSTGDLGALFVLRHEGAILAGCIIHRNRDTVFLRHSFIDDAVAAGLGNIRVAPLITLEALTWGNAHGCRYADENGYIHGLDESHPLYRVYKYKEEFRPTQVQRIPGHQKVLRPVIDKSMEMAAQAKVAVKPLVNALRRPLRASAGRMATGPGGPGSGAGEVAGLRQRIGAVKIPLGLTIGGAAGLFLFLLVD